MKISAKKTGPKTAEWRERSAMNSLKHGLTSNKMFVLENETPEKWALMLRLWTDKLQPRDEAEMQIVTEAAFARWRMQRVWTIETGLLDLEMDSQADELAEQFETIDEGIRQASAFKKLADESVSLELIHRYETRYRRSFEKALASLRTLREMDLQPEPLAVESEREQMPQSTEHRAAQPSAQDRNHFLPNESRAAIAPAVPLRSPVPGPVAGLASSGFVCASSASNSASISDSGNFSPRPATRRDAAI